MKKMKDTQGLTGIKRTHSEIIEEESKTQTTTASMKGSFSRQFPETKNTFLVHFPISLHLYPLRGISTL